MSKKLVNDITDLVNKWASVRVAFPISWSDETVLNENVSYKTYLASDYKNAHKVIEIIVDGKKSSLTMWSDPTYETSISKPLPLKKFYALMQEIYTRAVSIEGMAEGELALLKKISDAKKNQRRYAKEVKELQEQLNGK